MEQINTNPPQISSQQIDQQLTDQDKSIRLRCVSCSQHFSENFNKNRFNYQIKCKFCSSVQFFSACQVCFMEIIVSVQQISDLEFLKKLCRDQIQNNNNTNNLQQQQSNQINEDSNNYLQRKRQQQALIDQKRNIISGIGGQIQQQQQQQQQQLGFNMSNMHMKPSVSPMIQQKQDKTVYKLDYNLKENQILNPKCIMCHGEMNIQDLMTGLDQNNTKEVLCQKCNQVNFIGKCPKCFTLLMGAQKYEVQIEVFCTSISCPIGKQNLQNDFELDTLGIYVLNVFNQQQQQNGRTGLRMNGNMELEESKGDNIDNEGYLELEPDEQGSLQQQQQQIQNNIQEKYFEKVDKNQMIIEVKCYKCSGLVELARKKENIIYQNYKQEQCKNCQQQVYYIFCECSELIYSFGKFSEQVIECSSKCGKIQEIQCGCQVDGQQQQENEKCKGVIEYSIKQDNEVNQFYRRKNCQECGIPAYYFYCQCSQIIVQRQKPFQYGEIIMCPNENCYLKKIQLVRCPLDHCQQTNYFKGNYPMGDPVKCLNCENDFQQLTCPQCHDSLYFQGEYSLGNYVQCPCETVFQQSRCPYCMKSQFRIKDRDEPIQSGIAIKCDNQDCLKSYYIIQCSNCHQTLKEKNLETKFQEGQFYLCQNCDHYLEWFTCKRQHLNQHKIKKSEIQQHKNEFFSFGHRQCQVENCEEKLTITFCPLCRKLNKYEEEIEISKTVQCQHCQKNYITNKCEKCHSLNSAPSNNMKFNCFNCEEEISNYNADDPNSGLCKICYTERVEYVMSGCMHVVCCGDCMPRTREEGKCPLCRKRGEPKKLYF